MPPFAPRPITHRWPAPTCRQPSGSSPQSRLFYPLEPLSFQTAAVLFDLATAFILSRLLALTDLPAHRLLIYFWNPLVIVETAQGAHVDALMVMLMMLAVYAIASLSTPTPTAAPQNGHRPHGLARISFSVLAPALLALATLTKLIPLLMAPVFWWRWNWGSRLLFGYLVIAMLVSPALRAGWGLIGELDGRGLFGAFRIYQGAVELQQRPVPLAGSVADADGNQRTDVPGPRKLPSSCCSCSC